MDYKELNKGLPDLQNDSKEGFIKKAIYKVGINNYKVPIKVFYPENKIEFNTIATVSAYASLPAENKGVNMSRFSETITRCAKNSLGSEAIVKILNELKEKVGAENTYVKLRFDYLTKVTAPVSKIESWFNIPVTLEGELENDKIKRFMTIETNYMSLCPCSKGMSEKNAHNQRSQARIKIELNNNIIYFENLKQLVDESSSCPIWNTLKRVDEKYVTDYSYEHAAFTEDTCRAIADKLDKWITDNLINDYVVVSENFESIHQSNAIAVINAGRKLK